jgi:thiosulfate reductase cytochrome b subunit
MKVVKKHPVAIRWFHWINFPILTIMLWSGLLIYWANDVYSIRLGTLTLFKFFPQGFYKTLNTSNRLAEGMAFHFVFMWAFFLNGLLYILYTIFSGEWRYLLPDKKSFKEAWLVLLHDLHFRKNAPLVTGKYNAAQRIAYTAIIIMGFGSIITGLAIYKPIQFGFICSICGGYEAARAEHFILTVGYVLFFLVHIVQVIKTGWKNFQGMITGFETIVDKHETLTPAIDENEKATTEKYN